MAFPCLLSAASDNFYRFGLTAIKSPFSKTPCALLHCSILTSGPPIVTLPTKQTAPGCWLGHISLQVATTQGLQVGEGKEREGEGGWGHFTPLFGAQTDHRTVTLLQPAPLWSRRAGTRGGERRRQLCCGHGRSHHQETQPQRGRDEWWPKKEWEKLSVIHALNRRAISVQSSWKERLTRGSRGHARARAGCLAGTCHLSAPK